MKKCCFYKVGVTSVLLLSVIRVFGGEMVETQPTEVGTGSSGTPLSSAVFGARLMEVPDSLSTAPNQGSHPVSRGHSCQTSPVLVSGGGPVLPVQLTPVSTGDTEKVATFDFTPPVLPEGTGTSVGEKGDDGFMPVAPNPSAESTVMLSDCSSGMSRGNSVE